MIQLIKAEYFKLWKSKNLWPVLALASLPFLFAIIVYLDIEGLSVVPGAFSLFTYANNLWQFTVGTSLTILLFTALSASLGRELHNGTMVYQVTRVGGRNQLIRAKVWTLISLNVGYFLLFHLVGAFSYLFLIHNGSYGSEAVWDLATQQELAIGFAGLLIQIGFSFVGMFLSLRLQLIGLILGSFIGSLTLSFLSNVDKIGQYVPGSIFYNPYAIADQQFCLFFTYHFVVIGLLSCSAIWASKKIFTLTGL